MAFCPNCKNELPDAAKFCGLCGTAIPEEIPGEGAEEMFFSEFLAQPQAIEESFADMLPVVEDPLAGFPVEEVFPQEVPAAEEADAQFPAEEPAEELFDPEFPEEEAFFSAPVQDSPVLPEAEAPVAVAEPPAAAKPSVGDVVKKVTAPVAGFFQKLPKMALILGGAGIAGVLVIVLVLSLIFGSKGADNYILYFKDSELCYSDFSKDGAMEVSSHMFHDDATSSYDIAYAVAFTEDNSRIFYPTKTDRNCSSFTLNYRDLAGSKGEGEKVDSDVISYAIDSKGKQAVYIKGDSYTLFWSDLEDKEKIEKDVSRFFVNDDLSQVLYQTRDRELYLWTQKNGAERVARDVEEIERVTNDLAWVFYMDGDTLMRLNVAEASEEEIAEDICNVYAIHVNEDGSFYAYYTKEETVLYELMDYINDPNAAADAALTEPEYPQFPAAPTRPTYPYSWNFENDEEYDLAMEEYEEALEQYNQDYEEYQETCGKLNEEYETAYALYEEKLARDRTRDSLNLNPYRITNTHFYYTDGTEETVLSESLASRKNYASQAPVSIITAYTSKSIPKTDLADVTDYYFVHQTIGEALEGNMQHYLVVGNTITPFADEDAQYFALSSDGTQLRYLSNYSEEKKEGDLFKATIADGVMGEPEEMDTDVSSYLYTFRFLNNGAFLYTKDRDLGEGTLYIDGAEICEDVYLDTIRFDADGLLAYFTDWDEGEGTLHLWNGKESVEVADDVTNVNFTPEGDLVYLADFSTKRWNGDLCLYRKGKILEVDSHVTSIIRPYRPAGGIYGNTVAVPVNAAPAAEAPAAATPAMAAPAEAPAATEAPASIWP